MHVLLLSAGYPTTYNPTKSIFHQTQAEALAAEEHQVGVIAVVPISLKEVLRKKVIKLGWFRSQNRNVEAAVYQYLSVPKLKTQWLKMPIKKGKKEVVRYIEKHGVPDVVHLHSFQAGYLALWVKEEYGIKVIVTEHSSRFYNGSWSNNLLEHARYIFSKCDYRIAVSALFSEHLSEVFGMSFTYIPNCVDTDFFEPTIEKKGDYFTFICVAHFTKNKNQQLIANAFVKEFLPYEKVRLLFYGEGEERGNVARILEKAGRNQQVVFVGDAGREELKACLNQSQVLLSSSKVETFGITVIEAMSMGKPVISTRSGGPQNIIVEDYLGTLVEDEQMGAKMRELYQSYINYDSKKIRGHAVAHYSSKVLAKKLEEVYRKL